MSNKEIISKKARKENKQTKACMLSLLDYRLLCGLQGFHFSDFRICV